MEEYVLEVRYAREPRTNAVDMQRRLDEPEPDMAAPELGVGSSTCAQEGAQVNW